MITTILMITIMATITMMDLKTPPGQGSTRMGKKKTLLKHKAKGPAGAPFSNRLFVTFPAE
jgi:hypothetical protein